MNKSLMEYLEDITNRLDRIEKFLNGVQAAIEPHEFQTTVSVPKIKQVKVPLAAIMKPDFLVDDRSDLEKGVVASSVLGLQDVPTGKPTQAPPSSAATTLQNPKKKNTGIRIG